MTDVVGSARITIDLDGDQAVGEARVLGRRIEQILSQSTRNSGRRMSVALAAGFRQAGRVAGGLGRALRTVGEGFGGLVERIGSIRLLSNRLGLLARVAGALGPVLAPAAGAIAALPAAAALATAGIASLVVALNGVGDAFGAALSGDAAEFQEALAGLAPAAANVARELRAARPAFDDLRRSVQGALFAPLQGEITALVAALRGPLTQGMSGVAGQFGRLIAVLSQFTRSTEGVRLVNSVFGTLRAILAGIRSNTVERLLTAISRFTQATLPAFARLGGALDGLLNRFSAFLERAAQSGQALAWVEGAFNLFRQLGQLLSNSVAIFSSFFGALSAAGGAFVNLLIQLTGQLRAFLASTQGQSALTALGQAVTGLVNAFSPLTQVVTTLIATGLRVLTPLLQLLAPIIRAVSTALAGVVAALAPMISALVAQLMPVLQPLSALLVQFAGVVGQAVVAAVQQSGPALVQLVGALGQVVVAAIPLVQALLPLVPIIGQLAGEIIGGLLPALVPLVQQFAQLLRVIVPPLAAVLRVLAQVVGTILTVAVRANINGNRALISILTTLTGLIVGAVVAAFRLLAGVINVARGAWNLYAAAARGLWNLLRGLTSFLAGAAAGALRTVTSAVNALRSSVSGLGGPINAVIAALSRLIGLARQAFSAIRSIPSVGGLGGILGFADGGIIRRPTVGLVGEAGPEVIIPLTRPARARRLAEESGLSAMLAQALPGGGKTQAAARGDVHNTWHIYGNSDPEQTARRVLNRMVLAGGF